MKLLRRWFLKTTVAISKWASKIHVPFSRKRLTGLDYYEIQPLLSPGTVLLTRTDGELSNVGIPGFWSHVALYLGNNTVIEATTHGVVETDLVTFLMGKDYACALDPRFTVTLDQSQLICLKAITQKGKQYDYEFNTSDITKFYCSELIWWAYSQILG